MEACNVQADHVTHIHLALCGLSFRQATLLDSTIVYTYIADPADSLQHVGSCLHCNADVGSVVSLIQI